jgi:hypothetical protein
MVDVCRRSVISQHYALRAHTHGHGN